MWISKYISANQGINICIETEHFSAMLKLTLHYSLPIDVLRLSARKG